MAQAAGYRTPHFLTFKQAMELGGNVRKGERGTKVYFVKQLQVRDQGADDSSSARLISMMRPSCAQSLALTATSGARGISRTGSSFADKRAFFTACSQASEAADYLRGLAVPSPPRLRLKSAVMNQFRGPLFDVHPQTCSSFEVFYADRTLETFGKRGAG